MTEPTPAPPRQSPVAPSAADLLGPQEVLEIQELGHTAGYTGESPLTCPWKGATEEADIARRHLPWQFDDHNSPGRHRHVV